MNFKIPETVSVPGGAVSELIDLGDGDAALLYLYLTAHGGLCTPAQAAEDLSWSLKRTNPAFDKLISHKLAPQPKSAGTTGSPSASTPSKPSAGRYAISEMQAEKQFYTLVQEIQRLFARMLSSDELVRLFGIYDSLGLPPEVILQLVVYCMAETCGRDGISSPPSMKYIEKAAYTWEREGIFTLERAEQYIKERAERKQENAKIKALLQIHDRNLTQSERRYVDGWLALGFTSETIAIAYDRTVTKTGKLSWSYMNSIVSSWHGKGLYTAEDILAKDNRHVKAPRFGAASDAPDEKEVDRINRILRGLNEENRDVT